MKKLLLLGFFLLLGSLYLSAQNTVSGTVQIRKVTLSQELKLKSREALNRLSQNWMVRLRWKQKYLHRR